MKPKWFGALHMFCKGKGGGDVFVFLFLKRDRHATPVGVFSSH